MTNVARLPGPIADIWDWQRMGLCRGRDSAQFFHPDGERGASRGRREAAAKQLCRTCPVRAQCAAHALATREPYGVWGGFTEAERLRLLAIGWEDAADRRRARVDIGRLEARLGLRPPQQRPVAPAPHPSRTPVNARGQLRGREPGQVPGRGQPAGRGQVTSRGQVQVPTRVLPAPRTGVRQPVAH
jgi:WhiB family redox-sensing transcriptional regulator